MARIPGLVEAYREAKDQEVEKKFAFMLDRFGESQQEVARTKQELSLVTEERDTIKKDLELVKEFFRKRKEMRVDGDDVGNESTDSTSSANSFRLLEAEKNRCRTITDFARWIYGLLMPLFHRMHRLLDSLETCSSIFLSSSL